MRSERSSTRSSSRLAPDVEEQRRLAHQLVDQLLDDWQRLADAPVLDVASHPELVQQLREELPHDGHGLEATLERFWSAVRPSMTRVDHPRFHAFIPSPSSFPALLGQFVAASTNPFVGSWLGGASVAALEVIVLQWIAEAIRYPSSSGILTSGGSLANLCACVAARHASAAKRTDLSPGQLLERSRIFVSDQVHDSIIKSARVAGYPAANIVVLPTRDDFTLDPRTLRTALQESTAREEVSVMVCANGGTTNTGAVDPLADLADVCDEHRTWLHVDAAYGGFAILAERAAPLFAGLERADSLTLDPHKWLYSPMGIGCFLTRHDAALAKAFETTGDYLKDVPREQINFFDRGPELSRPGRGLVLWTLLRSVGFTQLSQAITRDLELAIQVEHSLRQTGLFEIVAPTALSVVSFAVAENLVPDANRATRRVYTEVLRRGRCMVSTTELRGRVALRFVVLNPRSDEEQLAQSIEELTRVTREVVAAEAPL